MKRRKNTKKRHLPRRTGHLTKFRSSLPTTNSSSPRPSPMANTSTSARTSSTPQHEHPFRAGSSASPRYSRSFVPLWLILVTSNYLHSSGWASFIRYPICRFFR
ncbi:hypothetical protein RhiirA1_465798 [Rhizophagus irregularis]|uniref:Uncharacterized protein n=1 Tax=Rhizophagus irregularis TaxID=588596 RepID=A0A2N0RF51_9GLOM|nr:hypothetical protein RhiirA1_465798 [Rhizophagus irregularis]